MTNSTLNSKPVFADSIFAWRQRYERLGLRTIPLIGKKPFGPGSWTSGDAGARWQQVGADFAGNIGIQLGDRLAVVDADDEATAKSVACGLNSMGLSTLEVKSPHGVHFYLKVDGVPADYNCSRLPAGVGEGEFRAQNSYVVAPLSQIDGAFYRWMNGKPESLAAQPVVQWSELAWLLPVPTAVPMIDALPIRLLHRDMPPMVRSLLNLLRVAPKGQSIGTYDSRSEAEAAVISMLILAGWPLEEILSTFDEWRPGKYWESKGRDRQRYFDRTYYRALTKIASHPTRLAIAQRWQAVKANPLWPGSNGYAKRDALLALLAICWQFGSWEIFAPQRSVAEYVAATQFSISKVFRVLRSEGLIEKLDSVRAPDDAIHWRVNPLGFLSSQTMICDNFSRTEEWDLNELWSAGALGRSAGTIYGLLTNDPVIVSSLSRQTGKAWSTVDTALERLERSGLSKAVQGGWIRGARALREVANEFGTKPRARRRREKHAREREYFVERLQQFTQNRDSVRHNH